MTQIQSAAMGTTSMKHQFAGIAGQVYRPVVNWLGFLSFLLVNRRDLGFFPFERYFAIIERFPEQKN